MTHLLHQMVHYRTTLRGSEQRSATIARITIHTHATILNIKRRSSESCAMRYLLRVTLIHMHGWVQDGTLLDIARNEVWVFLCKNLEWGEYKHTQQIQPHPRRGNKQSIMHRNNSRIRLGFNLRKATFLCRGSFERKDFQKKFSSTE